MIGFLWLDLSLPRYGEVIKEGVSSVYSDSLRYLAKIRQISVSLDNGSLFSRMLDSSRWRPAAPDCFSGSGAASSTLSRLMNTIVRI